MSNITEITLTTAQYKGLQYVAADPQEWAENAVTERARLAVDEIVRLVTDYCLDNDIALPANREAMVNYAYDNDLIQTAANANAAADSATPPA